MAFIQNFIHTTQTTYSEKLFPKFFAGWAFLTFLITFNSYLGNGYLSTKSSLPCFPFIQGCKKLFEYFNLIPLPYSYSESIFFALLFALIVLGVYLLYTKEYAYAHLILVALLLVKIFIILTNYGMGNFDYYDVTIILVFLLYPARIDLIKLTFVILYFLASTIKIHEGWILGTYFSSLYYGLPLVPDILIPVATNIVIIMQMVGCWFLLSSNKKVSDYTVYFFIFFHLYSTILVGYRYPITSLLSLLIIFIISKNDSYTQDFSIRKNMVIFYVFICLMFVGQSIPYFIQGDNKITMEGNNYGLYMFEANHQCTSYLTQKNGKQTTTAFSGARNRCDPYILVYAIKKQYCTTMDSLISWRLDHSINGEPFTRIIDVPNVCSLSYEPFSHNEWIKTDGKILGKVYKNVYLGNTSISNTLLKDNEYMYATSLSNSIPNIKTTLQLFMEKYIKELKVLYWTIWFGTLIYMIYILLRNTFKRS